MKTKKITKGKLRRIFTFITAITLFVAAFVPASVVFAETDWSYVRVKLTYLDKTGTETSKQITVNGNYYIDGAKDVSIYKGKYNLTANGKKLTLTDGNGTAVLTDKDKITFIQCESNSDTNYLSFGDRNYLGNIEFKVNSSNKIQAINTIYIEDYLVGVVAGEISSNFAMAAIEAQVILARTYAVSNISTSSEYDLVDTSTDQVYKGFSTSSDWKNFKQAVKSTSKEVLYCDGELVPAHYTHSNGGFIEIYQHNWYAKKELEPYDVVRVDNYDFQSAKAPKESLKLYKNLSGNSMSTELTKYIKDLMISKIGGELVQSDIELVGVKNVVPSEKRSGHTTMPSTKCKNHGSSSFDHSSYEGILDECPNYSKYEITVSAKVKDAEAEDYTVEIVADELKGGGDYPAYSSSSYRLIRLFEESDYFELVLCRSGHGNGLSQSGAYQMGKLGFSCDEIVSFYYPHCEAKAVSNISSKAALPSIGEIGTNPNKPVTTAVGTVINGGVNIRSGASTSTTKLGELKEGSIVEIVADDAVPEGWYKIYDGGSIGYVSADYVKIDDFGMTVTQTGTMTGSEVNIRKGPGTDYDKITKTGEKGESIGIIQANAAKGWHRVYYNGVYGYISASYVSGITGAKAVTAVSLDKTSAEVTVGNTLTLTATITPTDATNKNVSWTSSDANVATVNNGVVTAVATGTANITAKAEDGSFTAVCAVTVKADSNVPVTSVSISDSAKELFVGNTHQLTATVNPDNASNKSLEWTSSNESAAKVDSTGKITAVAPGNATITVKTADGGFTASCAVTVKPVAVTEITLSDSTKELDYGGSYVITATVKPDNATNKTVIWTSSDEKVATVKDGVVTAKNAGTARITAKTEDGGFSKYCDITVKEMPADERKVIEIAKTTEKLNVRKEMSTSSEKLGTLAKGSLVEITGNINDWSRINYNGKTGYVVSSYITVDPNLMKVTGGGKITASEVRLRRGPGTSFDELAMAKRNEEIQVIGKDANAEWTEVIYKEQYGYMWSDYISAKTLVAVKGIAVSPSSKIISIGESTSLTASITPSDATNKTVIWASSDSSIAKVSSGKVTGLAVGTVTITATSSDGGFKAECKIEVVEESSGNSLKAIGTVNADSNVYAEKSTSSSKLGKLIKKSLVEIIETTGDWTKINYNGKQGYISSANVTEIENGLAVKGKGKLTGTDVNFRRGPGTSFDKLGKISKPSEVSILDTSSYSGWYRIFYNGTYGYMSSSYISIIKEEQTEPTEPIVPGTDTMALGITTGEVNIRKGPGTNYGKDGKFKKDNLIELLEGSATNGWFKIKYNGEVRYLSADYLKVYEGGTAIKAEGIVTGSDVNLRRGPGTSFDKIGLASKNSKIYILKENAKSGWHMVLYNGVYGYMSSKYIKIG